MARRHPALPILWLMTDERQGDALWDALEALPRGSGVVFRHHRTVEDARGATLTRIVRIARRRGLLVAYEVIGADGVRIVIPQRVRESALDPRAAVIGRAHDLRGAVAARRAGALAVFVSPVFATRTHVGDKALGPLRASAIPRRGVPSIALGGMTARRFTQLQRLGFAGWAAIDGLTPPARLPHQKRKAVPI